MNRVSTHNGEKNRIASSYGDTIFIDASTTTECMAQYLAERKNLTVITNNMAAAAYLSECGVRVICLGGEVLEMPCMLGGDQTVEDVERYRADKMFFSTRGITCRDEIGGSIYYLVHKAMMRQAGKRYYLADHEKVHIECNAILCSFDQVDGIVSDYDFPGEVKQAHPGVRFIHVPVGGHKD